jgi:hypothetical protein
MQQLKQVILAFALIVCGVLNATAQATPDSLRADSVLLSVFNTGAKYRLTPATFAPRTTGAELLTEMVMVQDTIVSFVETGGNGTSFLPPSLLAKMPDSLRQAFANQRLMKPVVTHRCDKPITTDVKGKVVIMSLGTCDPSLMCLNAQRAGAKAIVLIHPNNNRDSILLKNGAFADSITIPCYTVRRDIGARMSALMPSQVGIKKPIVMDEDAQGLKSNTNTGTSPTTSTTNATKLGEVRENTEGSNQDTTTVVKTANGTIVTSKYSLKGQFTLSPNPANDMATLTFNLSKKADLTLEILNEAGQMMLRRTLQGAQTGSLDFDTRSWASGAYLIHLTDGKGVKTVKRLVVQH